MKTFMLSTALFALASVSVEMAAFADGANVVGRAAPSNLRAEPDLDPHAAGKGLAAMLAIVADLGPRLGTLIVDPSRIPDLQGLARMNRRKLQSTADEFARAASRARAFRASSGGLIAEARRKVATAGADISGSTAYAAGLQDGFDRAMAKVLPRLVKLSGLMAAYDDAAREQVLFLLRHFDRMVRTGDDFSFREDRLVDGYNTLVDRRNARGKIAKAVTDAMQ